MNVLLIDDHPLVLAALHSVMREFDSDVGVVTARTARQALEAMTGDPGFDLVLLDLHLGDADGFELLEALRKSHPSIPIVVISASDSNDDVTRAIYLGAMGFVPKRASNSVLFDALSGVMTGNIYVPPMSLRSQPAAQLAADPHPDDVLGTHLGHPPAPRDLASLGLTPRQGEVLALLMKGQSNKLIARALNLSVETIKDHVAAVLRSLKVKTRTQAVLAVSHLVPGSAVISRRESTQGAVRFN